MKLERGNSMENKCTVISVESRKGGVGKTTAALNLGKLLLNHGYAILFLDLDITGTNIADSIDSPFWKDDINVLGNKKNKGVNLLELFEKDFMAGKYIPKFSTNSKSNFTVSSEKIKLIGSQIYNHQNTQDGHYCICSPSVLFDELHSFWFVEFIKELSKCFSQVFNNKTAVIIDNSPGFVGICPALHQWLTDMGPLEGKFLTISGLDVQDIISCCHSVNGIHSLLLNKHETSKQFHELLNDKKQEITNKSFFFRLLEERSNLQNSDLHYYLSNDTSENVWLEEPFRYQNWIINKVPREIKKGIMQFDVGSVFAKIDEKGNTYELPRKIWQRHGGRWGEIPRKNLVSYDEYIDWQFLFDVIRRQDKLYHRHLEKRTYKSINKIEEQLHSLDEFNLDNYFYDEGFDIPFLNKKIHAISDTIKKAQNVSEQAVGLLTTYGLPHISRLIRAEWYPEYPIRAVKESFNSFLEKESSAL